MKSLTTVELASIQAGDLGNWHRSWNPAYLMEGYQRIHLEDNPAQVTCHQFEFWILPPGLFHRTSILPITGILCHGLLHRKFW